MAISLATNVASLNATRHLERTSEKYQNAAEKLASGKRINKIGDDAAGLAISEVMEARIRSIQQAKRNSLDALSLFQVAEGGMNEVGGILVRMRELSIQGASDNIGDQERQMLNLEVTQLKTELDRLAGATNYFGTQLLNGTGRSFVFQIGPDNNEYNRLEYSTENLDMRAGSLGVDGLNLSDKDSALSGLEDIDKALSKMNEPRSIVGGMMARFGSIVNNLALYEENLTAAKSRILDADVAKESANSVQAMVLQKAGLAVLAQANAQPLMALKLIE